jgi:predicted ATPase/class 3 adenylate cyclase
VPVPVRHALLPEGEPMHPAPPLPTDTVTFLFTDIEGSTRLWELHPEAMCLALARHDLLLTAGIHEHGGQLVKSRGEGDSFFAVFPHPTAALAAAALQQALLTEPWPAETPLRVRMALHVAPAELREGDYYGPGVIRCARLRAVAHGGQVLLSEATADRVRDHLPAGVSLRDLGSHRLKDLQQPERIFQLLHPCLPADFPPLRSLEAFAHNLPAQLTSFIEREQVMAEVKQLLATTRLPTLTGSGGCGKTRLALQVGADLVEEYADGVWLVELAALADPGQVPQTVAAALGVREEPNRPLTQTLLDDLRPKQVLLVLDNCEHLLSACAHLADPLLRGCPHLRLLATSREALGITGEQTYRVPSLSLPDLPHLPPLERLHEFEAVQLFADRAGLVRSDFTLTEANAAAVVQVCRRLDGIPLAIELAGARVRVLSVEQVAARLDDRFRLLTGGSRTALPRQQTLRALIDWSYDLLSEPERVLLRRLSVFAGGWTLEAAEGVCGGDGIDEWEILDLLTELVDKSLVVAAEQGEEVRYRLLETIRQYGQEKRAGSGEEQGLRGRHRDWFLGLAEQAAREWESAAQEQWLERLEREHDNVRAALGWSVECGEAAAGLQLGTALYRFWEVRGYLAEGRERLAALLAVGEASERTVAHAKALNAAAFLASRQGDYEATRALCEESLVVGREVGDKRVMASSLNILGHVAIDHGDTGAAWALYEESLRLWRELGDTQGIAMVLNNLGSVTFYEGDYQAARALHEETLVLRRQMGAKHGIATSIANLAEVARHEGDWERARAVWAESLPLFGEMGDRGRVAEGLQGVAAVSGAQGQRRRAVRLLGAAEALREAIGSPLTTPNVTLLDSERVWVKGRRRCSNVRACARSARPGAPGELRHSL